MGSTATATDDSISADAFQASAKFASSVGSVKTKLECAEFIPDPVSILTPVWTKFRSSAARYVRSWHRYLDVDGLHSPGCLRAAYTTVFAGTAELAELCEQGHDVCRENPLYWTAEMQAELTDLLEDLEDIQYSLTLLMTTMQT